MAKTVIDRLETVQIKKRQTQLVAATQHQGHGLAQPVGQQGAVGQSGQGIKVRQMFQIALMALAGRHIHVQGDKTALRQRHPADIENDAAGQGALHVVRFEPAGALNALVNLRQYLARPVIAALGIEPDDILKPQIGPTQQRIWQIKQGFELAVERHHAQVFVHHRHPAREVVDDGCQLVVLQLQTLFSGFERRHLVL
ncbi:hypothetical protein GALL_438260 [mine drainage metagenome]|uniref:Uncharacterized protein n=1 Tax=mine drainage metagenome TaxID=410659 RepID=A0A1J5Q3E9_9ZZZZ